MARPKKVEEQPKIVEPSTNFKKLVNVDSIEAFTPESDRMVTGIFRNIETPGQPAKITMRLYKGQPIFNQTLEDGVMYTIPLSIARGIREYCQHMKHSYQLDDGGRQLKVSNPYPRYDFVASEFK